jgi:hypothetical protein
MITKVFSLLFRILLLSSFILSMTGEVNAASLPPISFAGNHTWTVRPLNKTPDDSANVQQAINSANPGDTIKLAVGVFNFGDFDSVSVGKDITIEGAWDKGLGVPLTTIQGGFTPFVIGRKTPAPIDKPEKINVGGHNVYHITQDFVGKFYFPFLYPPYYDNQTNILLKPYDLAEHWSAVEVNVRQITFQRPYFQAIYIGAMRGGTIERCRFISSWPGRMDFFQTNWHFLDIQVWNIQSSMGMASSAFKSLPNFSGGDDFIRGDLIIQSNDFESDYYAEVFEGAKDASGHVVFISYDKNVTPPENDYKNYVVEDLYSNPQYFDMHPVNPPALYWVRKGYNTGWGYSRDGQQMQVMAFHGQLMGLHVTGTETSLSVRDNVFQDVLLAMYFAPNGQFGQPFNAFVEGNTIKVSLKTTLWNYWGVAGIIMGDWWGGTPGTNAAVNNNNIDLSYTGPGNIGGSWNDAAIDLEIMGKATVTGNVVKMNSEGGILFSTPTKNGVAANNTISGAGDYAFLAVHSDGNQFINNDIVNFMPTGPGLYNLGWGLNIKVPVPAARGILYKSKSTFVQGIGMPGLMDSVYDCGQNNQIINMNVLTCP